jgi:hypothetical protein
MAELESLVKKINRTNGATALDEGTLTDAIVARDCLRGKIDAISKQKSAAHRSRAVTLHLDRTSGGVNDTNFRHTRENPL